MRTRVLALLAAAVLALAMIAGPGIAFDSDGDTAETNSSTAEISLVDCVVESSKDISYVALLDDGGELDKFNVNAPTYDLSGYDGIEDVTDVRVKSGETVETFAVDCPVEDDDATDPHGDDDDADDDGDDTTDDDAGDDGDDTTDDDADDDGDDDVTQPDSVESHNDDADTNSQAVITLSGCTVNSSKDISYVAFFDGGEQLDKDETVGSQSYNLHSFGDIDEVDRIRVKAGTTVATFGVNCGTADTDDDATDDESTDEHGDDDDANEDDATDDDVTRDENTDDTDDADDDADDDAEWDARHDGRHEHKDHEEIQ